MEAYNKIYLMDVQMHHGNMFARVEEYYPGYNLDHFVEHYLASDLFKWISDGEVHYLNLCGIELLDEFLSQGYQFVKGPCYLANADMRWVGEFYARFQWRTGVSGPEMFRVFHPHEIAFLYPTFHTLSLSRAVDEAATIYAEDFTPKLDIS